MRTGKRLDATGSAAIDFRFSGSAAISENVELLLSCFSDERDRRLNGREETRPSDLCHRRMTFDLCRWPVFSEMLEAAPRRSLAGFSCRSAWAEPARPPAFVFLITVADSHRHRSRCAPASGYTRATVMEPGCRSSNDSLESVQFET